MLYLVVGIIVFFGIHLLPTFPVVRQWLINWLGENGYKGMFALVALIGLNIIGMGVNSRAIIPVWDPPAWLNHLSMVIMLPVFILIAAAYLPSNIKRFLRHPMLTGVSFWAVAHLLTNGDLGSMLLFGSFLLYSIYDIRSANRRGAELNQEIRPVGYDIGVILLGLAVYVLFFFIHPYIIGVPVLG